MLRQRLVTSTFTEPTPLPTPKFNPRSVTPPFEPEIFNYRGETREAATNGARITPRPLSYKQKRFLAELLSDPKRNATQAMVRAGYAGPIANITIMAGDLIKNPQIKAALEDVDRKTFMRLEITKDKVLQHIAAIAFSNALDFVSVNSQTGEVNVNLAALQHEQGLPIQDISVDIDDSGKQKVKFRLADKLGALQMLGKRLKLWDEPQQSFFSVNFLDKLITGQASVTEVDTTRLIEGSAETVEEAAA